MQTWLGIGFRQKPIQLRTGKRPESGREQPWEQTKAL
jgi:hypothetical protein